MRRLTRDPAELIPLKHATYQVLLALGDGESMHGYAIMQAISTMSGGGESILPGTLYAALARMVDEKLVEESAPTTPAVGRRAGITAGPASAAPWRGPNPSASAPCSTSRARRRSRRTQMIFRRARIAPHTPSLRAFPRRHRDAYAAEMTDSYERDSLAHRARRRIERDAGFVAAACLNP